MNHFELKLDSGDTLLISSESKGYGKNRRFGITEIVSGKYSAATIDMTYSDIRKLAYALRSHIVDSDRNAESSGKVDNILFNKLYSKFEKKSRKSLNLKKLKVTS